MTRRTLLLAAFLVAVLGCSKGPSARSVVLITLDTTRADRIGCYGYAAAETPNLDALARSGVRFNQAMAAVPTTTASHSTMFTGLYPPSHGVRYNGMFRLADTAVTITERLREGGIKTAGVPAAFPVTAATGLSQGFETYHDLPPQPVGGVGPEQAERRAGEVTDLAIGWIRDNASERFFLWVHYFDPHSPYNAPFPWGSRFRERPYDGEIAYVDSEIGRLLEALEETGKGRDVAILVVGDHGEGLFDHGERFHANLVYQSTLHVPLLIRAPRARSATVVDEPVTLADVGPTILDLLGAKPLQNVDGASLVPALRGQTPERRFLYFESLAGSLVYGWSPLEGLRRGPIKYVRSASPELFDLDTDPAESQNLHGLDTQVAMDMEAELNGALARWSQQSVVGEATETPLDIESQMRLASLGYVGGSISVESRGGPPPRDRVFLEGDLFQVRDLMLLGDYRSALVSVENVLGRDPTNRFALYQGALAHERLRERELAETLARQLVERYPEFAPGVAVLARTLVARSAWDEAEIELRRGLELSPGDAALVHPLTLVLLSQERVDDAMTLAELAASESNAPLALRVTVAVCAARKGDTRRATDELRRAIEAGFEDREVLQTEPLLGPLRALPEFDQILASIPARETRSNLTAPE